MLYVPPFSRFKENPNTKLPCLVHGGNYLNPNNLVPNGQLLEGSAWVFSDWSPCFQRRTPLKKPRPQGVSHLPALCASAASLDAPDRSPPNRRSTWEELNDQQNEWFYMVKTMNCIRFYHQNTWVLHWFYHQKREFYQQYDFNHPEINSQNCEFKHQNAS